MSISFTSSFSPDYEAIIKQHIYTLQVGLQPQVEWHWRISKLAHNSIQVALRIPSTGGFGKGVTHYQSISADAVAACETLAKWYAEVHSEYLGPSAVAR